MKHPPRRCAPCHWSALRCWQRPARHCIRRLRPSPVARIGAGGQHDGSGRQLAEARSGGRATTMPRSTRWSSTPSARARRIAGADARIRAAEEQVRVAGAALGLSVNATCQPHAPAPVRQRHDSARVPRLSLVRPVGPGRRACATSSTGGASSTPRWKARSTAPAPSLPNGRSPRWGWPPRSARPISAGRPTARASHCRNRRVALRERLLAHRAIAAGRRTRQRRCGARCEPAAGRAARTARDGTRRTAAGCGEPGRVCWVWTPRPCPRLSARPLPQVDCSAARRRRHQPARAPPGHPGQPLARGGRAARYRRGPRQLLSGHFAARAGRTVERRHRASCWKAVHARRSSASPSTCPCSMPACAARAMAPPRRSLDIAIAAYDDAVVNAAREAGIAATAAGAGAASSAQQREQQLAAARAMSAQPRRALRGELTHAGPGCRRSSPNWTNRNSWSA